MPAKPRPEGSGVMVLGIVQDQDHAPVP